MRLFQKLKKKTDYKLEKVMIYAKITELKDRYMIYNAVKNERKWRNKEMDCDNQELEATKKMREEKCDFCEKGEKFSTNYIDVSFQNVLPKPNAQVLIQFKGCPKYSKCDSKDFVQDINNIFGIKYCPMCR